MATSYKAAAIDQMLNADSTGLLRRLHAQLIDLGLRTRLPSNTDTLPFEAVKPTKERVGVAAIRAGSTDVMSLPRPYWAGHAAELDAALAEVQPRHFIETTGFVSSSQYSLRQVRISPDTIEHLSSVIADLLCRHARELTSAP
jgi:hypothetical protein